MEQSAYYVMDNLDIHWNISTPRLFGNGKSRVLAIDPLASDCHYRGKYGILSQRTFNNLCLSRSAGCSSVWITGSDVSCLRAAHRLDLPILLGHHYHHNDGLSSLIRWKLFYELLAKVNVRVTYPTDFTRNEALKISPWLTGISDVVKYHFPIHNISTHDKAAAKIKLGIDPHSFVLGNAGWLIKRKRWDVFLETCSLVKSLVPSSRFIICGGGPLMNYLKEYAHSLNLSDSVIFTGWLEDLSICYTALDVILFNSDYDALGRTSGEAMGYGAVPVASVRYGGISELIVNNLNGFLYDKHDPSLLAETVRRIATSDRLLEDLREAAKTTLRTHYSSLSAISFYDDFFNS